MTPLLVILALLMPVEARSQSYDWSAQDSGYNLGWGSQGNDNMFMNEQPFDLLQNLPATEHKPYDYWETESGKKWLREEERSYRMRQDQRSAERGHWMNFCNMSTHIQHIREQCYASW